MQTYTRGEVSIKYHNVGSGPTPVLLLHGFPDSSKIWEKQVFFSAPSFFRLIGKISEWYFNKPWTSQLVPF